MASQGSGKKQADSGAVHRLKAAAKSLFKARPPKEGKRALQMVGEERSPPAFQSSLSSSHNSRTGTFFSDVFTLLYKIQKTVRKPIQLQVFYWIRVIEILIVLLFMVYFTVQTYVQLRDLSERTQLLLLKSKFIEPYNLQSSLNFYEYFFYLKLQEGSAGEDAIRNHTEFLTNFAKQAHLMLKQNFNEDNINLIKRFMNDESDIYESVSDSRMVLFRRQNR